jgi:hypothetical protein
VSWSDARFDPDRAVAVLQDGKHEASGYLIAAGLVVTCEHFLGGGPLAVRGRSSTSTSAATLAARFPSADVALLSCDERADVRPVTLGQVEPTGRHSLTFEMYGWPLWSTERGRDGTLLEGGRLVRGVFEPADTSADGNLVLQPTRYGGAVPSGWSGMSGAAVFSLDRLIAVQRRLLNPADPSSIEARPLALLMDDPAFVDLTAQAGIALERTWAPRRGGAGGQERLELHGPSRVPVLSPAAFHVRVDGWPVVDYTFAGVRNVVSQHGSVPAAPVVDIRAMFTDVEQIGTSGRLIVEASGGEREDRTAVHQLVVVPPDDEDLAFGFETVVRMLDRARGAGSPSTGLRAVAVGETGAHRLRAAALEAGTAVAETVVRGLAGVTDCLAVEGSLHRKRLADKDARSSEDDREASKWAYHRAYVARAELRDQGLVRAADNRSDEERDGAAALFGFADQAALQEHLDPGVETLLAHPGAFERAFLDMLRAGEVDVGHSDFTGALPDVQAKLYDLVNALITEGWARWVQGYRLTLTQVGRAGLPGQ